MRTRVTGAALGVLALSACFLFERDTRRIDAPAGAPVEVRLGCALADARCTRCHTVDRIINAPLQTIPHWQAYVHRMRLQPQSGILPDEELPILRCLVYRSLGPSGFATLQGTQP